MTKIFQSPAKETVSSTVKYSKSLNRELRERELAKINSENMAILQRIQARQPVYNHLEWEYERVKNEKIITNLSEFSLTKTKRPVVTLKKRTNDKNTLTASGKVNSSSQLVKQNEESFNKSKEEEDAEREAAEEAEYLEQNQKLLDEFTSTDDIQDEIQKYISEENRQFFSPDGLEDEGTQTNLASKPDEKGHVDTEELDEEEEEEELKETAEESLASKSENNEEEEEEHAEALDQLPEDNEQLQLSPEDNQFEEFIVNNVQDSKPLTEQEQFEKEFARQQDQFEQQYGNVQLNEDADEEDEENAAGEEEEENAAAEGEEENVAAEEEELAEKPEDVIGEDEVDQLQEEEENFEEEEPIEGEVEGEQEVEGDPDVVEGEEEEYVEDNQAEEEDFGFQNPITNDSVFTEEIIDPEGI